MKLYVNGEFISEKNFTQGSANNESFRIGRHNSCDLQWFKGEIDEVLLFDIALTASQVLDLYGTE